MSKEATIDDLMQKTRELTEMFAEVETRPWTIETCTIELMAEIGTLADSIMIKESYRSLRPGQDPIDLEDDVVDVMFVLFMIANHYGINVGAAYDRMVQVTRKKIVDRRNP